MSALSELHEWEQTNTDFLRVEEEINTAENDRRAWMLADYYKKQSWLQKDWADKDFANKEFYRRQENAKESYYREIEAARQATISSDLRKMEKPSFLLKSLIAVNGVLLAANTLLAWLNGGLKTKADREAFKAELAFQRQRMLQDTSWRRWFRPGYWLEVTRIHKQEKALIAAHDPLGIFHGAVDELRQIAKKSPADQLKLGEELALKTPDARARVAIETLLKDRVAMALLRNGTQQSAHAAFMATMRGVEIPMSRKAQWTEDRKAALNRGDLAFQAQEVLKPHRILGIPFGKKRVRKSGLDNDRDYGYKPS